MKYILLLLLITSCKSAPWPANLTLDTEYQQEIKSGLKDLNEYFTPNLTESLDETHYRIFISTFGLAEPVLGMAMPGNESCDIILTDSLFHEYRAKLKSTLWHEIGHCAGLEHSNNPNDIMYYAADDFKDYSDDDIARFINAVSESLERKKK